MAALCADERVDIEFKERPVLGALFEPQLARAEVAV
jgi:hypothetical protein